MFSIHVNHVVIVLLAVLSDQGRDLPSAPLTFTAVSAGFLYTCGLTSGGAAYCWGSKGDKLGDGTTLKLDDPRSVFLPHPQSTPIPVVGGVRFASVNAGSSHTCAVTTAGDSYCWGLNPYGQFGDGAPTAFDNMSNVPVPVARGLSFSSVIPGRDHTCGLTTAGAAYCWGRNAFGVLGDGAAGDGPSRSSPAGVVSGLTFATLTVGDFHACGLTAAGAAYCWGLNDNGQLGDGTDLAQFEGRSSPVAVVGELIFATISAGAAHSCGVTSAGAAYCWGSNRAGQLGDGTTADRSTPTLVGGGVSFTAISAGGGHTCAVAAAGAAYCWGENKAGELGDETTTSRLTPTPLAGDLTFSSVSAGFNHTCGVTPAGVAYCWGSNDHGQLGDGSTKDRSRPVRVAQ